MKHILKIGCLALLASFAVGCASLNEWLNADNSDEPVGNPRLEDPRIDPDAPIRN